MYFSARFMSFRYIVVVVVVFFFAKFQSCPATLWRLTPLYVVFVVRFWLKNSDWAIIHICRVSIGGGCKNGVNEDKKIVFLNSIFWVLQDCLRCQPPIINLRKIIDDRSLLIFITLHLGSKYRSITVILKFVSWVFLSNSIEKNS